MPSVSPLFATDWEVTQPVLATEGTAATAAVEPVRAAVWRPSDAEIALDGQVFFFSSTSEETFGSGSCVFKAGLEYSTDEFHVVDPLDLCEATFRHSHWAQRRNRVYALLSKPGIASVALLEAFSHCGSAARAEYSPSTGRYRVRATYCHSRWCEPCMRARSGRIASVLRRRAKGKHCRFLTLTLKHTREPLRDQIDRLRACFARLRHSKEWKEHVQGGAVTTEVKLAKNADWHPHLHMILEGSFWHTDDISKLWKKITGDSYIVKIIDCGADDAETGKAVAYVCGYITKPAKAGSIWENEKSFKEMLAALKGRRMIDLLGTWRKWVKEDDDDYVDPDDWRPIGSITEIWHAAKRGEPWALHVLKKLNGRLFRADGIEETGPPDLFD